MAETNALAAFYAGRRVLVTGHTGFKGAWLCHWLLELGAELRGLALPAEVAPALCDTLQLSDRMPEQLGDLCEPDTVALALEDFAPELVFHLAAQSLVRRSYTEPLQTMASNVMGSSRLLEGLRQSGRACTVLVITTDKVYANDESGRAFCETDRLGAADPYASSKAMVELLVESYRHSFGAQLRLATCRAGNVIGGGDRAPERLMVDAVTALEQGRPLELRNPQSIRPWQHVLEPLSGYLQLGAALHDDPDLSGAYNFGPGPDGERPVAELIQGLHQAWGAGEARHLTPSAGKPEAGILRLDTHKAADLLHWRPRWSFAEAIRRSVEWYRLAQNCGNAAATMRALSSAQIEAYTQTTPIVPRRG